MEFGKAQNTVWKSRRTSLRTAPGVSATRKCHQLGASSAEVCAPSALAVEAGNQGVAGLVPSEGGKEQSVPGLSPNFWWPPMIFGPLACECITPTSVSPYMAFSLCVQISAFYRDPSHAQP